MWSRQDIPHIVGGRTPCGRDDCDWMGNSQAVDGHRLKVHGEVPPAPVVRKREGSSTTDHPNAKQPREAEATKMIASIATRKYIIISANQATRLPKYNINLVFFTALPGNAVAPTARAQAVASTSASEYDTFVG
jgi:hypothetical protein